MFEDAHRPILAPSLARQKLILWLAFVIILAVSGLAFVSTQQLITASKRVENSQNVLIDVNRFLSEIKDAESRSRGYFVTGDDRYLKGRAANLANAEETADRLRAVEISSPLRQRLDRVIALAAQRVGYSNRVIAQRDSRAQALESMRIGSDLMDEIRSEAQTIVGAQTAAYRAEQSRLERQAWMTSIALAGGVITCLGLIAWLFSLRGREVERRRYAS